MSERIGYHIGCGGPVRIHASHVTSSNGKRHRYDYARCSKCLASVHLDDVVPEQQVFKIQRTCGVHRHASRRTTDARSWKELASLVRAI